MDQKIKDEINRIINSLPIFDLCRLLYFARGLQYKSERSKIND